MNTHDSANTISLTRHFKIRFRKRLAHSKRIQLFAERAFCYGQNVDEISDYRVRNYLKTKESIHENTSMLKLYNGFVYVFDKAARVAITIYRLPNFSTTRVCDWAAYDVDY